MVHTQEWLDENYPCNCNRRSSFEFHNQECKRRSSELNLSNQNLVGDLDLTDFYRLREVNVSGNPQLGELKTFKEGGEFLPIIVKIGAQDWLNWKYPNKQVVKTIGLDDEKIFASRGSLEINGELVISDFPQLEKIWIQFPKNLTKIQANNCPQLAKVYCSNGNLSSLVFVNCPNLTTLDCRNNQLTNLDLVGLNKLNYLDCSNNYFDSLDLSNCRHLDILLCRRSGLTSLDTSSNPYLTNLQCSNFLSGGKDNCLTSLNLSKNKKLTNLDCSDNKLTELDLSNQTELTYLNCSNNYLKTIKLPIAGQEKLTSLYLDDNHLQRICNRRDLGDIYFFQSYSHAAWQDLSFLESFVNLKTLWLGNTKEEKIAQGIYNRFCGSLNSLKGMRNLESLNIENTDIEKHGLEHLPIEKLKDFRYSFDKRINSRVNQIFYSLCRPNKENGFDKEKLRKFQDNVACNLHYKLEEFQENLWEEKKKNHELSELYKKSNVASNDLAKQLEEYQRRLDQAEEKNNELTNELSIEKDHSQDINNWYKRQLDSEGEQKRNELFNEILELRWNNNQQKAEITKLENSLQTNKQLTEQIFERQAQEIVSLKSKDLTAQILEKSARLAKLKAKLSAENQEWLNIYCEAQHESKNSSFAQKQLTRAQQKLTKKLSKEELDLLIQQQKDIEVLKRQLVSLNINEWQQPLQEAKILQVQPVYGTPGSSKNN